MNKKFHWTQLRIAIVETLQQSHHALRAREIRKQIDYECSAENLSCALLEMWKIGLVERTGRSHSYCYLLTEEGRQAFEIFEKRAIAS